MVCCHASARTRSCGSRSCRPTWNWPRHTAGPAPSADSAWPAPSNAASPAGSGAVRSSTAVRSPRRRRRAAARPKPHNRPSVHRCGSTSPPVRQGHDRPDRVAGGGHDRSLDAEVRHVPTPSPVPAAKCRGGVKTIARYCCASPPVPVSSRRTETRDNPRSRILASSPCSAG